MTSQAKGGCKECGSFAHTKMYHKPKKPLKRTAIKQKPYKMTYHVIDGTSPLAGIKTTDKPPDGNFVTIKFKKKAKKRTESRSQLVKRLDNVFSKYIRMKDAVDGLATCVTCGNTKEWKLQQNGHYESRGKLPTRWDEINCHVQCYACNVAMKGNYTSYARYMVNRYGVEVLEDLHRKATSGEKIPTPQIREWIELYKKKVSQYVDK